MQDVIIEYNNKYENKGQLYLGLFETIADVSLLLGVGLVGFQSAPIIISIGSLGILGLGGLDIYKVRKFRYKLVKNEKNIQLATYLDEHRQEDTEIIRQEVDALREAPPTQNVYYPHPKDSPYSEKLYKQGLNLSIIDELSIKQQKQLRKIIKKRS